MNPIPRHPSPSFRLTLFFGLSLICLTFSKLFVLLCFVFVFWFFLRRLLLLFLGSGWAHIKLSILRNIFSKIEKTINTYLIYEKFFSKNESYCVPFWTRINKILVSKSGGSMQQQVSILSFISSRKTSFFLFFFNGKLGRVSFQLEIELQHSKETGRKQQVIPKNLLNGTGGDTL